jgi:lysozyme
MSLMDVQDRLRALGYDPGVIDGRWGPDTERAVLAAINASTGQPVEIDPRAIALIKGFEGFRSDAYVDPVGIVTIGYGTTAAADVGIIPKLGMHISESEAETYLMRAVAKFAASIRPLITAPITPAQFGAFVSLAYNIGPAAFGRSSALRKFNAGDEIGAADAMLLWNKAGGRVLAGLKRRREAERGLFLAG